jgi:hypothetical protein
MNFRNCRRPSFRRGTLYLAVLLAALAVMLFGCSYRFSPGGEHLDKAVQSIFVDNFANNTDEPYVNNYLRNEFIDQFRKTSRFRLADASGSADAIVKGSIKSIAISHLAFDKADRTTEDRAIMAIDLAFEDLKGGKILWSAQNLTDSEAYLVNPGNPAQTNLNKKEALQKLSNKMAERAYRNLMSGF